MQQLLSLISRAPRAPPPPHKHRHPRVRRFLESDGEEVARAPARQALPLAGPNGGVASVEVTVDTAELRRCKPNEESVVTHQVDPPPPPVPSY